MKSPVPFLSLMPPWATMILMGSKRCENRTWSTSYRGPLVLHASARTCPDGWNRLEETSIQPQHVRDSEVICLVDLFQIDQLWTRDPWEARNQHHWRVANPVALPPYQRPGALGLFEPDIPAGLDQAIRQLLLADRLFVRALGIAVEWERVYREAITLEEMTRALRTSEHLLRRQLTGRPEFTIEETPGMSPKLKLRRTL